MRQRFLLGVSACRTPFPLMVDPKGLAPPSNWVRASCSATELRVDRPPAVTYRDQEASPDAGVCGRRLKGQDSNLRAGLLLGWLTASCLTTRLPLNVDDVRQVGGHLFPTEVISWRGRSRTHIFLVNSQAHCLSLRLCYTPMNASASRRWLPRMGSNHRLQPYYGRRSPLSYSGIGTQVVKDQAEDLRLLFGGVSG